jgi:hypothetical protein
MPILHKQLTVEITIEQFLKACSDIELQELDLRLPAYLRHVKRETEREPLKIDPI